jgi:sterol 3beta-glucosyltransferase
MKGSRSILILTSGTRGDVQPFLALAGALAELEYDVVVAAHNAFRDMIAQSGMRHEELPRNPSDLLTELDAELNGSRSAPARFRAIASYVRQARQCYRDLADHAFRIVARADAVLVSLPTYWLSPIAFARGIPVVCCPLQPLTPTREFPSPLLPCLPGAFTPLNRMSHALGLQAIWQPWRATLRAWARKAIPSGIPGFRGPLVDMLRGDVPFLYGFSPHIVPRPRDWPAHHVVTGYWIGRNSASPGLPPSVQKFMETTVDAGASTGRGKRPLVYVGFGSAEYLHRRTLEAARTAILRLGFRAIIHAADLPPVPSPDILHWSGPLPHERLFPAVDGIVHHGGAGTFASAALSGTPGLAVTSGGDMAFWARRGYALGISPRPLTRAVATAAAFTDAIALLVSSSELRARAEECGAALRNENGASVAAGIIDRYLSTKRG